MGLRNNRPRALIIPLLALVALVAGCGSGGPSGSTVAHIGAASTTTTTADTGGLFGGGVGSHFQQLVRFSECMRAHGEPDFPDPVQHGNGVGLQLKDINPNSPQFQAAQKACAAYAPPGIAAGGSPAKLREELDVFAACMRSHGVPNFPDPQVSTHSGPGGRGVSVRIGGPGLNTNSPQFAKAQQACRSQLPGGSA
jgi:hypothetical protein